MVLPHRIRRLRWHVASTARDEAFAARVSLRQMLDTGLLDEIGRAFDLVSNGDDVLRLPRLELVVRIAAIERLRTEVATSIQRELEHQLEPSRAVKPASDHHAIGRTRLTNPVTADQVVAYLASGTLPWSLATSERQSTVAHLRKAAAAYIDRILARVPAGQSDAEHYVFRWLQLLSSDERIAVGRRLEQSAGIVDISGLADAIASSTVAAAPGVSEHRGLKLATALIVSALQAPVAPAAPVAPHPGRNAGDADLSLTPASSRPKSMGDTPRPSTTHEADTPHPASAVPPAEALLRSRDETDEVRSGSDSPAPEISSGPRGEVDQARPTSAQSDAFDLTVEYSGLILIHPFLPQLFEQTGLWRPGESRLHDASLPRAAALLSYAARGDDEPIEFDLPLVKVLLGLRPETALPLAAGLLESGDKREADELLASVVEHWRALKHTSIAALRASFLQRGGLLAEADDGWRLRVEGRPFDLLLDQLPWGFSTVKLRWMTAPLFTEWMTP